MSSTGGTHKDVKEDTPLNRLMLTIAMRCRDNMINSLYGLVPAEIKPIVKPFTWDINNRKEHDFVEVRKMANDIFEKLEEKDDVTTPSTWSYFGKWFKLLADKWSSITDDQIKQIAKAQQDLKNNLLRHADSECGALIKNFDLLYQEHGSITIEQFMNLIDHIGKQFAEDKRLIKLNTDYNELGVSPSKGKADVMIEMQKQGKQKMYDRVLMCVLLNDICTFLTSKISGAPVPFRNWEEYFNNLQDKKKKTYIDTCYQNVRAISQAEENRLQAQLGQFAEGNITFQDFFGSTIDPKHHQHMFLAYLLPECEFDNATTFLHNKTSATAKEEDDAKEEFLKKYNENSFSEAELRKIALNYRKQIHIENTTYPIYYPPKKTPVPISNPPTQLQHFNNQIDQLNNIIASITNQINSIKNNNTQLNIKQMKSSINTIKTQADDYDAQADELKRKIENISSQVDEIMNEMNGIVEKCSNKQNNAQENIFTGSLQSLLDDDNQSSNKTQQPNNDMLMMLMMMSIMNNKEQEYDDDNDENLDYSIDEFNYPPLMDGSMIDMSYQQPVWTGEAEYGMSQMTGYER